VDQETDRTDGRRGVGKKGKGDLCAKYYRVLRKMGCYFQTHPYKEPFLNVAGILARREKIKGGRHPQIANE